MNAILTSENSKFDRRHFLGVTAATIAIAQLGVTTAAESSGTKPANGSKPGAHAHDDATKPKAQPPAKIIANPPLTELLSQGVAFIEYRTENLKLLPVFGPKALELSPRIGHLHVTLDNAPWHWAETSGNPVIVAPLPPGPHNVEIILVDANHQPLDRSLVEFVVPERSV